MWVLPTLDRPAFLRETLFAAMQAGITTPGIVVVNGSPRDDYADIELPPNWTIEYLPRNLGLCGALNWAFAKFPNEPWYGLIGDDMTPITPGFDVKMLEALKPGGIVSSNDNWQAENGRMTVCMIDGDLMRALGYWMPEGLWHCYSDDFWEMIGNDFQNWTFLRDVVVETRSPFKNDVQQDGTTKIAYMRMAQDKRAFDVWKREQKQPAYARIRAVVDNASTLAVSMGDRRVYIATPCGGNTVESQYLQSFGSMINTFAEFGVSWDLWTTGRESMIARARNIALKNFLDSTATDLLFIDADMGWEPEGPMRLLASGKDCVAVAGPRKQYPVSFCTLLEGPPVKTCPVTGLVEASYVGTGMMLITRACAQAMWDAYPDLAYVDGDSDTEYRALFDTEIREEMGKPRFWSEDYTWCHRYRQIGGKIYVDQSIRMQHVGSHVYAGTLADSMKAKPGTVAQAAE